MVIILTVMLFFLRRATLIYLIILLVCFFTIGVWRYSIALPLNTIKQIRHYNGRQVDVIGIINNDPDVRSNNQKLTITAKCLNNETSACNMPVSGEILVTTSLYPSYYYGEQLRLTCQLRAPEPFADFNYDRYLARYHIYSTCFYPKIHVINIHKLTFVQNLYQYVFSIKHSLINSINYGLVEPESALLNAMLLGNRRGLTPDILDMFSRAGISHIIAISGMHIAIIAFILLYIMITLGLSRHQSFILSTMVLVIYTVLVGMPASAMRASFMAILVMTAVYLGRLHTLINSLLLVAVILLLINPFLLRDDVGFQLSFLALLGIIYIKPIFNYFLSQVCIKSNMAWLNKLTQVAWEMIGITISAQFLTIPLIAYYFHQVSIIAPLANILVLPVIPFIMIAGMLSVLLSILLHSVSLIFFLPVNFLLRYVLWVAQTVINLPMAYVQFMYISPSFILLFYVVTAIGIRLLYKNNMIIL